MPRSKDIPQEVRKKIVDIYQSGKGYKAISKALGLARTTVRAIISKWRKMGTVINLPRSGRPTKFSPRARHKIIQEVSWDPINTSKELQASISSAKILKVIRMDKARSHMTERILNLTLEIIYLLTGEEYVSVKKFCECAALKRHNQVSGGWSRTQIPITVPPPHSLIHERNNDQKILELTNKIIQLLTGEELAAKKADVCKDEIMDNSQAVCSVGGSGSSLGFHHPTSSRNSAKEDTPVHENNRRGFIWKDSTSCEKPPVSLRDVSKENLSDSDTERVYAHVKGDLAMDDKEDLTGIYTQEDYSSINIKIETLSEEEDLTDSDTHSPTGHTPYSSINIKEEPVSGMEESLTKKDYTSLRIKEESSSCEEDITDTDIYSPSARTPSGSIRRKPGRKLNASQIVEPNTEGMYCCMDCKKSYPTNSRLIKHQRVHRTKTIPCPQCGKHFSCNSALTRHQTAHTVEKLFTCPDCGKCMSSKPALTVHQRTHQGEKPFSCTECGRRFLFKSHLVRHQIKHTGEKPFSCSECGKSYSSKAAIVMHQRLHTGDALYPCAECGKCFVQKNHLQQHLNIHTGEKPYACPECGKRFIQKSNLKQHMSVHVPKKKETFSCPVCGKCYKRRADFRWHMLIHLGEK